MGRKKTLEKLQRDSARRRAYIILPATEKHRRYFDYRRKQQPEILALDETQFSSASTPV